MANSLESFLRGDYMPHGHCYLWQPHILWTHVISDLVIAASYFSIPIAIMMFIRKRSDIRQRIIFWLFSSFILWCGITHLFSVYVTWFGTYGIQGIAKFITASVSFATAIVSFRLLPEAVKIPSVRQFEAEKLRAELETANRERLELEQKNQEIFRFATELAPIGLLIVDRDQNIRLTNSFLCDMLEYAKDELVNKPLATLIDTKYHSRHSQWVECFFQNPVQTPTTPEGRIIYTQTKSGRALALEINLALADYDGEAHVFASIADATDRMTAKKTLADKTQFLESVLSKSICGLYLFDLKNQRNHFINESYKRITGYDFVELNSIQKSKSLLDLFHPDEMNLVNQHFIDVKNAKGHPVPLKYRFKHAKGHWVWCYSFDAIYSYDDDGEPKSMIGTFIDISDVVAYETTTKSILRDYKATFDQAAVGIAHLGLSGSWLRVNQKFCDIVGYRHDEMLKMTYRDITYQDDVEKDSVAMAQLVKGDLHVYQTEKRYIKKNGDITWINLTVSSIHDDDGKPDYLISVVECIDRQKAAEHTSLKLTERLQKSNAQLEQFAYAASHDLQEPLRKIYAFANSLKDRLEGKLDDEDAAFELDRLCNAANRMRRIISDLLNLSRVAKTHLQPDTISLQALVDRACENLNEVIKKCRASILVKNSIDLQVDDGTFIQVLQNLIGNAIKYKKENTDVEIVISGKYDTARGIAKIEVQDNGIGFDTTQAVRIFEPFKRLVGQHQIEGSGIGLAICKQIVEAHGGIIYAEGNPNAGAVFTIELLASGNNREA